MRVLVTGATGFLGGHVLRMLATKLGNNNVVGTGRNLDHCNRLRAEGYTVYCGDLGSKDFVASELSRCDTVVHCAAKSSPWGSYKDFYRDNVIATVNLLEALPDLHMFIYISTPGIYFEYKDKYMVREDSPLPPRFVNAYAKTKFLAEQEVLRFNNPGLSRVILRPRAIVGPGDRAIIPRLIQAHEKGSLRIIGDGKNISDFSSVANVAHAVYLSVISEDDINGKIFNITDGEPLPMWELISYTLEKLGYSSPTRKVPYWPVKVAAAVSEIFQRAFSRNEPSLTSYGAGLLRYSCTLDISEARKHLGYKPLVSTRASIDSFIQEYKKDDRDKD